MDPHSLPSIELFNHHIPLQIRFNDIDILGHVNNTVYFSFYDTGKARFFESILPGGIDWRSVESVIANIDNAYIEPIYFGEEIDVYTRCKAVHEKSFILQQMIVERDSRTVKSCCETVMVSIDPRTVRSIPVPDRWRTALERAIRESEERASGE